MFFFIFALLLICIVYFIFLIAMWIMSEAPFFPKEKLLAFECGMETISTSRIPFSMQFFFISIIFVLFDMEIIFLIHFIFMTSFLNMYIYYIFMSIFLFFLFFTLLIEWKWNSFNWIF